MGLALGCYNLLQLIWVQGVDGCRGVWDTGLTVQHGTGLTEARMAKAIMAVWLVMVTLTLGAITGTSFVHPDFSDTGVGCVEDCLD